MATGRKTQLTRQVGEHLVAAQLGREGIIATPFAGNVPEFDLLVADEKGRAMPIQVKTINGASWQFSATSFLNIKITPSGFQKVRGKRRVNNPDLVCIFVLLRKKTPDEFYILKFRDLQNFFAENYKSRKRPKNPNSTHCAIWPKHIEKFRDNWALVFSTLETSKF